MTEPSAPVASEPQGAPTPTYEQEAGYISIRAALIYLLSRVREDLDGGRPLTEQESEVLRDLAYWWESRPWQQTVQKAASGQDGPTSPSTGSPQ